MSVWSEQRQAWSWLLSGAAAAFGVAASLGQVSHAYIWQAIVASRRGIADGRAIQAALSNAMHGLWMLAIVAVLAGGSAFFLARQGTRARWMAVAGIASGCAALWLLRAYEHYLRWS